MSTPATTLGAGLTLRDLVADDLEAVVRIDARSTGKRKPAWWRKVFERFLNPEVPGGELGLGMADARGLVGFLFGEVRAFEFGSDPCGWVFAVGVDPRFARGGTASRLLDEACRCFRTMGVDRVRTMVRRNDVPLLAFFRANGFAGGAFVQLERPLEEGDLA